MENKPQKNIWTTPITNKHSAHKNKLVSVQIELVLTRHHETDSLSPQHHNFHINNPSLVCHITTFYQYRPISVVNLGEKKVKFILGQVLLRSLALQLFWILVSQLH